RRVAEVAPLGAEDLVRLPAQRADLAGAADRGRRLVDEHHAGRVRRIRRQLHLRGGLHPVGRSAPREGVRCDHEQRQQKSAFHLEASVFALRSTTCSWSAEVILLKTVRSAEYCSMGKNIESTSMRRV